MADIAQLGFMVNTSGLTKGQTAMGGYAATGRKTEKSVVSSVKNMNSSFLSLNRAMVSVVATFAVLAAGNFFLDAARSTNSFTQSLADLSAITGAVGEDLEFFGEQAAQIGRTTSLSASQAVTAFKLIASAKPDLLASAAALNAVTREAVTLAEATGIELTGAASALGSALNQFGLDASKANDVINILAASSKLGSAEVASVTESLKNSGSAARSLGIDLAETVAGIQALAKAGIQGAEAGTALRQVFLALESTNDKALMPSINGLVDSLNELKSRNLDTIELMGIFGREAFSAATSLLAQSEVVEELNTTLRGTSVATEQASIRMNTLTGDLLALGSAMEGLQIATLGGDMNEFNRSLVQLATEGINSVTENIEAFSEAGETMAIVIALGLTPAFIGYTKSLGSAAIAQLTVGTTATKTVSALGAITVTAASATVATNALTIATRFLLGPWGLLVTALGFAAVSFTTTRNASEKLREENEKSLSSLDKLTAKFENFSKARLGALSVKAQEKAIEIDQKRIDINERLNKVLDQAPNSFAVIESLQSQLSALNAEAETQEGILTAVGVVFDSWLPKLTEAKMNTEDLTVATTALSEAQLKTKKAFEDQIASLELQKAEVKLTADEFEIYSSVLNAIANESTPEMISAITDSIVELQKLRKELKATEDFKDDMEDLTEQVENFGGAWSRSGSLIVDAFGDISDSLNDYMKEIKALDKLQTNIDKNRKIEGADQIKLDRLQQKVDLDRTGAELKGIKSLSIAGASLFEEKTAAAKGFSALNKIITIAEIALSFQKISASNTETASHIANETTKQSSNALTAITSAFAAPFPVNFIAGAAMALIMGGLLSKSFGGGGSITDPTEATQAGQGTGTLLGSDEKSQSILNAQGRFEDIAIDQLSELKGIRSSLSSLSSGIEQLARSITVNLSGSEFSGSLSGRGFSDTGVGKGLKVIDPILSALSAIGLGDIADSFLNNLFGKTTKKVVDQGIIFIGQSLGDIMSSGIVQAEEFFNIEVKKSRLFGLSKSTSLKIETQDIDNSIKEQIGAIFGHIGDTVLQSAMLLGFETVSVLQRVLVENDIFDSDGFGNLVRGRFNTVFETVEISLEDALSRFQVNIGQISLEGLSGEEIQQELQAIFSQQADLIAEFLIPSIANYQKIGEGLFDTLLRVTKEQVIFNDNVERMGINLSEVSSIMKIEIAQSIIELTGGLEKFSELSRSFFDNFFTDAEKFESLQNSLTDAFEALDVPFVKTIEGFRELVAGVDTTTEAGQQLFASLLSINPALSDFINQLEDLEKQQAAIRKQQLEDARDSATEAFAALKESVSLERQRITAILDVAREAHSSELGRIASLRASLDEENELRKRNLINAESVLMTSFNTEKSRIQENANARIKSLNQERAAIASTTSAMGSLISNITSAIGLDGSLDLQTALSGAQSGDFTRAQGLNVGELSNLSPSGFSSAEDLAFQQAVNQNRLLQISNLAEKQLSESELQLNKLDEQILLTQKVANDEISALDEQLKSLLDIDENVISVNNAIQSFQNAQLSLDALNFKAESEKLDLLKDSADEVFLLHEESYEEQQDQLDSIIDTNNQLLNSSLNINNSVLTIPVAIQSLKAEIVKLKNETVFYLAATANNTETSAEADTQAKNIGVKSI